MKIFKIFRIIDGTLDILERIGDMAKEKRKKREHKRIIKEAKRVSRNNGSKPWKN